MATAERFDAIEETLRNLGEELADLRRRVSRLESACVSDKADMSNFRTEGTIAAEAPAAMADVASVGSVTDPTGIAAETERDAATEERGSGSDGPAEPAAEAPTAEGGDASGE